MKKLFRQSPLLRKLLTQSNNARSMSAQSQSSSHSPPPITRYRLDTFNHVSWFDLLFIKYITASCFIYRATFLAQFTELSGKLSYDPKTPDLHPLMASHLNKLLQYTVPGGKMNRGLSVPHTYSILVPQCQRRDLELASVLGWTVELLQVEWRQSNKSKFS